jgi:hypothetical protein
MEIIRLKTDDSTTRQFPDAAENNSGDNTYPAIQGIRQIRRPRSPAPPRGVPGQQGNDRPQTPDAPRKGDDGVQKVQISGYVVKTSYSTQEFLQIVGDAFSKPFTSLFKSVANTKVQLTQNRQLTKEEQDALDRVGGALDKMASLAPTNGATQFAGAAVNHVNQALHGKMPTPEQMIDNVTGAVATFSVNVKTPMKPLSPGRENVELTGTSADGAAPAGGVSSGSTPPAPKPVGAPPPLQGEAAIQRIQGQGPINILPVASQAEDQRRIEQFSPPFRFYRNDRDVSDMQEASAANATDAEQRDGVLAVGPGENATSYSADEKAFVGKGWLPRTIGPSDLTGARIIKLGSGKNGVAAMNLRFEDLPPGSTTIVTGGAMRNSTMLFAADPKGFYAYHAGQATSDWSMAEQGARSIVNAHEAMRPGGDFSMSSAPQNNRDDLMRAARQYPFSSVVYNGAYDAKGGSNAPDDRITASGYAPGSDPAHAPNSNVFSYFEPGLRAIGTAEAVISRDNNNQVTVCVLAEKGRRGTSLNMSDGSSGFRYGKLDNVVRTYKVQLPNP